MPGIQWSQTTDVKRASAVTGSSAGVYHRAGRGPDPLANDDSQESLVDHQGGLLEMSWLVFAFSGPILWATSTHMDK